MNDTKTFKAMQDNDCVGKTRDAISLSKIALLQDPLRIFTMSPSEGTTELTKEVVRYHYQNQCDFQSFKDDIDLLNLKVKPLLKEQKRLLICNPLMLAFMDDIEEEDLVDIIAADDTGRAIRLVKNPSYFLEIVAMESSRGKAIESIINPNKELQILALDYDPNNIERMDSVAVEAIEQLDYYGMLLHYSGTKEEYNNYVDNVLRLKKKAFKTMVNDAFEYDVTAESMRLLHEKLRTWFQEPNLIQYYNNILAKKKKTFLKRKAREINGTESIEDTYRVLDDLYLREDGRKKQKGRDVISAAKQEYYASLILPGDQPIPTDTLNQERVYSKMVKRRIMPIGRRKGIQGNRYQYNQRISS